LFVFFPLHKSISHSG